MPVGVVDPAAGAMQPNSRASHEAYLRMLRRMTPEQGLLKSLELSARTRYLLEWGLRERFGPLPEAEFRALLRQYLEREWNAPEY